MLMHDRVSYGGRESFESDVSSQLCESSRCGSSYQSKLVLRRL